MSRRDLGTNIGRRGKTVDKSAMEQMLRRERAMRKKRRKQKSISLAAAVSKNVIALATLQVLLLLVQNLIIYDILRSVN